LTSGAPEKRSRISNQMMKGESYHNKHHRLGGRVNFGIHWFGLDPTYTIILLLNFFGIIRLKLANYLNIF
jgi:stearoyl-CoA desaturase (delta-9 desaturase)